MAVRSSSVEIGPLFFDLSLYLLPVPFNTIPIHLNLLDGVEGNLPRRGSFRPPSRKPMCQLVPWAQLLFLKSAQLSGTWHSAAPGAGNQSKRTRRIAGLTLLAGADAVLGDYWSHWADPLNTTTGVGRKTSRASVTPEEPDLGHASSHRVAQKTTHAHQRKGTSQ